MQRPAITIPASVPHSSGITEQFVLLPEGTMTVVSRVGSRMVLFLL